MVLKRLILPAIILATISIAVSSKAEENKPASARKELKRIQEQLKGVKKKEKEAVKQERSVLTDLDKIDRSLSMKRAEVRKLEGKLAQVSREITTTGAEMEDCRAKAKGKEADLANRLRAMYKTERAGGPWVLLVSGDYGSMLRRYKYLSVISRHDKRLMDGYEGDLEELSRYNEKLKDQQASYDKVKQDRDAEARRVLADEAEKKRLLASIRQQKGLYESMARELEESGRRMRDLLKRLEQESRAAAKKALPGNAPSLSGGFDWPVSGRVISSFGKQKHPEYNTYIYKNGIEIQAPMGADVKAVESGVVAFANWFKGLGLVAILRHGGDYYSVYAHLSELRVKAGDRVAKGQAIASIGDTGAPSGPSLYFEVRKGAEALDPMRLLRKR